jgi:hypothetical protein
MANLYSVFKALLPETPLLVGVVYSIQAGGCYVTLPSGGRVLAKGEATIGQTVFVKDGIIQGIAPSLAVVAITI